MNEPWITAAIKNSIRKKYLYFKLFKQGLIDRSPNVYHKTLLNKLIKLSKCKYFHDYFDKYKGNAKKTWTAIKNMTGKS